MFTILFRLEVTANILRFYLDGQRVGYEVEFSAAHNFLDPDLEKIVIGNAKQNVEGNKGCKSKAHLLVNTS